MYHSTYFAYGFQIRDSDLDLLEQRLQETDKPDHKVGYLHAGGYGRSMTFLVTECTEVKLGQFKAVFPESFARYERTAWDNALRAAATALGITDIPEPGWLVVPDLS
jgi:hypothetical protein